MPKAAGADMKTVQLASSRPQPPSRTIKHQERQPEGPHRHPVQHSPSGGSNKLAADAVRAAKNPGSIDPRQMRD